MVGLKLVGKGKKSKRKETKAKKVGPGSFEGPGDLRAVRYHIDQWRKNGVEEARNMLMMLGRDASFTVCEVATERKDEALMAFGRRLVAVRPQLETNLNALRRASVRAHVERARKEAAPAVEVDNLAVAGGAVAVFDPERVVEALARGGWPRKDEARVNAGDVAWFGLPRTAPMPVRFTTRPADGRPLRLRLRVESGVVFAGAPEASDGPRLGTVRRDPHHTQLDAHLSSGRFLRVKPGVYLLDVVLTGAEVTVHLGLDPDPEAALAIDLKRLSLADPVDVDGSQG